MTTGLPLPDSRTRPVATCLAPQGCAVFREMSGQGQPIAVVRTGAPVVIDRHVPGPSADPGAPGQGGWYLIRAAGIAGWVRAEWFC